MTQIRVIPAEPCLFLGRRGIRSLTLHSELTATGYQKHDLKPGMEPQAEFAVTEPVIAAYEYCNLHGLWVAKA